MLRSGIGGPIARTVTDVARVFEIIVGYDPEDNLTALIKEHTIPSNYSQFLDAGGLQVRLPLTL